MESSTKEILAVILLLAGWTVFILAIQTAWKAFQSWINPTKPDAWAEPYARRKIKFPHPKYKNVEGDGIIVGIKFTNDKAKGGGYKMKLEVDEGQAGITPIWKDSKWEYVDVKAKP